MYQFYFHCPLVPLLVLFLLPIYLHHVSLRYPATTRYTTALLLVYHHLLTLLLHHSPIVNWLLAGASYVIAMRVVTCMQLPPATNPLYTPTHQPVPFLAYFIFLFTATPTPPQLQPSYISLPPTSELTHTAARLLVKVAFIHVAVHALLWLSSGKPSSSLLSYHNLPSAASTLLVCSLMSLLMYCALSAVAVATSAAFSALCASPLPPLFHAPYLATSPRSFWSTRWNTLFTKLYAQLLFRPLAELLKPLPYSAVVSPLLSALAVFLLSGALHCHQSLAAFHLVYPSTLCFFVLQFGMCAAQVASGYKDTDRRDKQAIERGWGVQGLVKRGALSKVENAVTLLCLNLTTRWFWPPYFDGGFIQQLHSLLLV